MPFFLNRFLSIYQPTKHGSQNILHRKIFFFIAFISRRRGNQAATCGFSSNRTTIIATAADTIPHIL